MAYTKDDLAALKKALASGVKRVTYGDKTVEYRSFSEMKQVIGQIEEEVTPESVMRCRRKLAAVDRGYFPAR
jgi:hypothetical protein